MNTEPDFNEQDAPGLATEAASPVDVVVSCDVEPFTSVSFREDVLKLHILYLEKIDHLSKGERDAYEIFLHHLSNPIVTIKDNYSSQTKRGGV